MCSGVVGSVAGLASLVSFPVLLALGLPPVTANVTNTVALVFSSVGSVSNSRVELRGQGARIVPLAVVSVAGGVAGGALLLTTPAGSFEAVVPWLVGLASLAILLPRPASGQLGRRQQRLLPIAVALIGVYGGYFGAAAGVLMLAMLLAVTDESLPRCNAVKNVLLGCANAVAAVAFALFGPVRWLAVVPLAAGFLVGGRLGPALVRRAPAGPLRAAIAVAGLAVAAELAWKAYH